MAHAGHRREQTCTYDHGVIYNELGVDANAYLSFCQHHVSANVSCLGSSALLVALDRTSVTARNENQNDVDVW